MDCLWQDRYTFDLNGIRQRLHRVAQRSIQTLGDVERRRLTVVALGFGYSAPHQGERA
jgi:hypothetical protein